VITKVSVENFRQFREVTFDLDDVIVLAGPNNTGKSTLLQALSTWSLGLERWRVGKGRTGRAKQRSGSPVTRKDFTALPLREFDLLWSERSTALTRDELASDQKPGEPRLIRIAVSGSAGLSRQDPWKLAIELRYQGPEQIYVKPLLQEGEEVPAAALQSTIVHCPPFSGIGSEERRLDKGAQNLEVGRGKPGDIIRNLLLEVSQNEQGWTELANHMRELFNITLLPPEYDQLTPFILCEYLPGIPKGRGRNGLPTLDLSSAGSGLLQVLLLLAYFYARPASVFLLDEPDAHLHVVLQRQIYDRLRQVALKRECQLVIATHSEVLLDGTAPRRVISFLGRPHPLVRDDQKEQVREAMKRLTTQDLLLAEQEREVLYCEGESDFKILNAFAEVLQHPSLRFFEKPFFHTNEDRNPREARGHLFALRAIRPQSKGLLILDGDNRQLPEREIGADGLTIIRWHRYEVENYLVVPQAIRRFIEGPLPDLFSSASSGQADAYLRRQLPPQTFDEPLTDNATVVAIRASKDLLPQMFESAGKTVEKEDFFLIAAQMLPNEVHSDVVAVLNAIAGLLA
jgi:predicted ATPase